MNNLDLPALRCCMGNWIYYIASMTLQEAANRINITLVEQSNNSLGKLPLQQFFIKPPVIAIHGGSPEWLNINLKSTLHLSVEDMPEEAEKRINETLGILRFSGEEKWIVIEGQQRIEDFKQALSVDSTMGNEEISIIFVGHEDTPEGITRSENLSNYLNVTG